MTKPTIMEFCRDIPNQPLCTSTFYCTVVGLDGVCYGSYKAISRETMLERKPLVMYFEGPSIIWTDAYHDPVLCKTIRITDDTQDMLTPDFYKTLGVSLRDVVMHGGGIYTD